MITDICFQVKLLVFLTRSIYVSSIGPTSLYSLVLRIIHGIACRRVLAIRNLNTSAVVGSSGRLLATPLLNDRRQNSPTRMAGLLVKVRSRVRSSLKILIEGSGIAGVEED